MLRWMRMKPASSMGSSGCWGLLNLCVLILLIRITKTFAAADASSSFYSSLSQPQYPAQSRSYDSSAVAAASAPNPVLVSISSSIANQNSPVPFEYSSNGITRTSYPSYVGYPVYPSSYAPNSGYSLPSGAVSLGRSYQGNAEYGSNLNSYSAYPSTSYSQQTGAVNTAPITSLQPSARSFSPYAGTYNNYLSNNAYSNSNNKQTVTLQSLPYQTNIANYALSYRSSDPAEPEDPADADGTKKLTFNLPQPQAPQFAPPNLQSTSNRQNVGKMLNSIVDEGLSARTGIQTGTTEYNNGIGNGYAASAPQGATYNGPAQNYARATGYGQEGYAQSSPNTVSGSVYNPNYGNNSAPSFYGASNKNYGLGGFSSAALFPFYLYYPVEYGYDQGEQSVMPTGGIPLIGFKRRYGYRRGPFYGYGIYVDYPPYFGFGKVKDGWGSDPEADLMAATSLSQGSDASAAQSVYSSNGNSNAQQAGGYNPNNGNYGGGQTTGYGSTPSGGSYTAATSMMNNQNGYNSGASYPTANSGAVSPTYQQNTQNYPQTGQPMYSGQNYNSQPNDYMQNGNSQYGSMPQNSPYGGMPQNSQYGSMPQNSPYGSMPQNSQYGSMPQNSQYGSMPQSSNYGDAYGTSQGVGGQYGSSPGNTGQTTNYMYNNYADPSQNQPSQYTGK